MSILPAASAPKRALVPSPDPTETTTLPLALKALPRASTKGAVPVDPSMMIFCSAAGAGEPVIAETAAANATARTRFDAMTGMRVSFPFKWMRGIPPILGVNSQIRPRDDFELASPSLSTGGVVSPSPGIHQSSIAE
jgi:hypothetical protein